MPTPSAARSTTRSRLRQRRTVITIDGPSGVGKSTVAKMLADRLRLQYLDTGATYRALACQALRHGIDPRDDAAVARLGARLRLTLSPGAQGRCKVALDGEDVTREIRLEPVTEAAAIIAQFPTVRAVMVRLQQRMARGRSVVAEGRDTGSVVFPRATHKFFLDADMRIRARRRHAELVSLRAGSPTVGKIQRQLASRDHLDRSRRVGPLMQPPGSTRIDTTSLTASQVVARILSSIRSDGK